MIEALRRPKRDGTAGLSYDEIRRLTPAQALHALGLRPDVVDPKERQAEAQERTFDAVCARLNIKPPALACADPAAVCQAITALGKTPPALAALPALVTQYLARKAKPR